jgi:hypothetical protein
VTITRNPERTASADGPDSIEVLLREAKRRSRLRRLAIVGVVLVVTALIVALLVADSGSSGGQPASGLGNGSTPVAPAVQSGNDVGAQAAAAGTLQSIPSSVQVQLTQVSCSTVSYCMAIGQRVPPPASIGPQADSFAELWTGAGWSVVTVPLDPKDLAGVSCPVSGWCMLVGTQADRRLTQFSFAEVYSNGQLTALALPPSDQAELSSVSCTSPTNCIAVGTHAVENGQNSTFAMQWNGTTWHVMRTPRGGKYKYLLDVSCGSPTTCMAVGYNSSGSGPSAELWNGAVWSDLGVLPHLAVPRPKCPSGALGCGLVRQPTLQAVSCSSSSFCMATGGQSEPLIEIWNGRAWHLEGAVSRKVGLLNISCAGGHCYGVGAGWTPPAGPTVVMWTGTGWHSIAPKTVGALANGGSFYALSCLTAGSCVAVGSAAAAGFVGMAGLWSKPLFANWDANRWTVHLTGPLATSWPSHQSRHVDAIRAAQAMLDDTLVPAGSSISSTEPAGDGGKLRTPSRTYDTPNLVDLHRFYVVPGSAAGVAASMAQHPPSGSSLAFKGTHSDEQVVVFTWPTSGPLFNDQAVLVNAVPLAGGGTGLRIDADVVWLPTKPRGDLITSAGVIDVQESEATSSVTAVISRPKAVATVLRFFNQLAVAQQGSVCPNRAGPKTRLVFKERVGSRVIATVVAVGTTCLQVRVRQFGHWILPELQGSSLVNIVNNLAGIRNRCTHSGPRVPYRCVLGRV